MTPTLNETNIQAENHRAMGRDGKITNNWIQQCMKGITHHNEKKFVPGMQGWFNTQKPTHIILQIGGLRKKVTQIHQQIQKKHPTFFFKRILEILVNVIYKTKNRGQTRHTDWRGKGTFFRTFRGTTVYGENLKESAKNGVSKNEKSQDTKSIF